MLKAKLLPLGALGLGAALLAGPAVAGSELFDPVSTCTARNCNSQAVTGNVFESTQPGSTGSKPWVAQIFKGGGDECLRIAVITQTGDLDAVAILTCAGFPQVTWVDDDSGGDLRPRLIAADPTPPGWCTLTISQFGGENEDGQFQLRFGRYSPANQPNCSPATDPLEFPASAASQEKAQ
jgi:hypothetical protein